MNKMFFNDCSIWLSSDTFVEEMTIFPINFIIETPGMLICGIVLNTEIGPDVSSLFVEWYHNDKSIINNTLGYSISSLPKMFAKEFNSTLKISQVEASHSGKYTCATRIGEENRKKSSEDICVNCMYNIKIIYLSILYLICKCRSTTYSSTIK